MSLSAMIKIKADECAASHSWIKPWDWMWASTEQWDMANANWDELDESEPDVDQIWQARDLSDAGDFFRAMSIWTSLAEQGSVRSMIELGVCHEYGCGAPVDLGLAEIWYQKALAGGSHYAMLKCAHLAASRQNFPECDAILQPGADNRWASAAFWQAWYRYQHCNSKETYLSIFPLLKMAAKCGHPGGQTCLANFMVRGKFGILRVPTGFLRTIRLVLTEVPRHRPEEEGSAAS